MNSAFRPKDVIDRVPQNLEGLSDRFQRGLSLTHLSTPKNDKQATEELCPTAPKQKFEFDLDDVEAPEFLSIDKEHSPFQLNRSFLKRAFTAHNKSPKDISEFDPSNKIPEDLFLPELDIDDQ